MRISPVSSYSGMSWGIAPIGGVSLDVELRRLEAMERRERERIKKRREYYLKATTELAVDLNDRQAWNYNSDGSIKRYDVSGAMFYKQA